MAGSEELDEMLIFSFCSVTGVWCSTNPSESAKRIRSILSATDPGQGVSPTPVFIATDS